MDKQKNSQVNVPTGDQPFLHIHEGVLISLYVFFDCYVICGLFVGVLDLLYCAKVRAHAIHMCKNTNLFR